MNILILGRDARLSARLRRSLAEAGHAVQSVPSGGHDVALLDLTEPDARAFDALRRLTGRADAPPVIVLVAAGSADAAAKAIDLGAADFVTVPVSLADLANRMSVRALLRRRQQQRPHAEQPPAVRVGDIVLDYASRKITRGPRAIALSTKEFSLLDCLAQNRGRPIDRLTLLEHVWGKESAPRTNVVEVFVCRLRKKLVKSLQRELILTLRDGYALEEDPAGEG